MALGCGVAAGVLTSLLGLKVSLLGLIGLALGCSVAAGVLTSLLGLGTVVLKRGLPVGKTFS